MGARRAGTTAVVVVVGALLVVVLATWAATIGPSDVLRGDGIDPVATPSESASAGEASTGGGADGTDEPVEDIEVHAWVKLILWVVNVALLVLLALLLFRYVVQPLTRWVRQRQRRRDAGDEPGFVVMEAPQRVARALLDDAVSQRRMLLEGGSPRNAIVECWSRFETAAAAAGLEPHPWETSSEFTIRVLDLVDAHEPAVARLAELYREARFSEHDLTETDRAAALEALDLIHRTIGVPA